MHIFRLVRWLKMSWMQVLLVDQKRTKQIVNINTEWNNATGAYMQVNKNKYDIHDTTNGLTWFEFGTAK
jgi:hypothetical protein